MGIGTIRNSNTTPVQGQPSQQESSPQQEALYLFAPTAFTDRLPSEELQKYQEMRPLLAQRYDRIRAQLQSDPQKLAAFDQQLQQMKAYAESTAQQALARLGQAGLNQQTGPDGEPVQGNSPANSPAGGAGAAPGVAGGTDVSVQQPQGAEPAAPPAPQQTPGAAPPQDSFEQARVPLYGIDFLQPPTNQDVFAQMQAFAKEFSGADSGVAWVKFLDGAPAVFVKSGATAKDVADMVKGLAKNFGVSESEARGYLRFLDGKAPTAQHHSTSNTAKSSKRPVAHSTPVARSKPEPEPESTLGKAEALDAAKNIA